MGKFLLIRLSLVTQDMIYPPIRRKQVQTSHVETFEIGSKVPAVPRDRGSSRRSADRCGARPGGAAHPNHKALTPAGARAGEAALGLAASSRRGYGQSRRLSCRLPSRSVGLRRSRGLCPDSDRCPAFLALYPNKYHPGWPSCPREMPYCAQGQCPLVAVQALRQTVRGPYPHDPPVVPGARLRWSRN